MLDDLLEQLKKDKFLYNIPVEYKDKIINQARQWRDDEIIKNCQWGYSKDVGDYIIINNGNLVIPVSEENYNMFPMCC